MAIREELKIFDILTDINFKKTMQLHNHKDFDKAYNSFMINRYLSMDCETIIQANMMNRKHVIPNKAQYFFLTQMIEKKNRFLKYIKKDAVDKKEVELVKNIMELYQLNKIEAMKVFDIIDEEEKDDIKEMFKIKKKATKRR